MKNLSFRSIGILLVFVMVFSMTNLLWAQSKDYRIIEIVALKEGITPEIKDNYYQLTKPYFEKYQIERTLELKVTKKARGTGPDNPVAIHVYKIPDPSVLEKILADEGYKQYFPYRGLVFDFDVHTMFLATSEFENQLDPSKMVIADFIVMKDGNGAKERDAYFKKLTKIADDYNMEREALYSIEKYFGGQGPKNTVMLNLWQVPDMSAMMNVVNSEEYKTKMVPIRDQTFNMDEITVYLTGVE